VQAWGLRLFGDTVSGLRTSSAVVGVLTLPLVYLLARSLFGAPVGLLTMVLMACAHWFIAYAHLGINYNQTTFLEVVAVWTFWEGYRRRRWHWFILSGLATGAGLYLYFASRLVPILLAAFAMSRWQMADSAWQIAHGCWQTVGSLTQRFPRFTFHVSRFAFHVSRLSPLVSRLSSLVSRFTLHVSRHSPRFAAIRYPPFVHSLKGTLRRATRPSPILPMRYFVLWLAVTLLVFAPMGVFFAAHLKELSSRADFVFLFNDPVKVKDYTGTTDYPSALFVQTYRYAALFNAGSDRSGQYGNQAPLLDYYTAVFFVLGLAYALARWREPRFTLLLLWIALTIFIGGVLTIESPFTPRIVGLMPVPFMLAALALVRLWRVWQNVPLRGCANSEMSLLGDARIANGEWQIANSERPMAVDAARHPRISLRGHSAISHLLSASRITNYQLLMQKWLPRFVVLALLVAIAYNNAWLYFERYLNTLEGWAQREIATTVARYATTLQADQTLYVLGAPELFVWHGTIKFLAPNLRGDDILNPDSDLPIRDPLTRRASFVVAPSYLLWLEKLQQVYPNGQIKEFRRPWGELWFIIYEVSAEEIEKKRP
jgi:4-amino-4-deoxy-L-arabinose transferase-like glycosyltransferase